MFYKETKEIVNGAIYASVVQKFISTNQSKCKNNLAYSERQIGVTVLPIQPFLKLDSAFNNLLLSTASRLMLTNFEPLG